MIIIQVIRKSNTKEVALEDDNQDILDDLGYNLCIMYNADLLYLYIANFDSFV